MGVWYATREDVKEALDSKETARNNGRIDRALESASRSVEGQLHRRFYPQTATRYWDWPNEQTARPWRLWLDESDLISVSALSSGGTTIDASAYILEPNRSGPPYSRIELKLSTSASFGGGSTHQRDITVTGLWGYRNDEAFVADVDEAMTTTETDLDVTTSAGIGVGSVLRVGSERLIVTGKTMKDTGVAIDVSDALTASAADVSLTVSTLTGAPVVDEVILIDSERMLVVDVAGSVLTVKRAWDGSVLAAHTAGARIYAPRTLAVSRGALGTTAATMSAGDDVYRWSPPGPVQALTVAEASNLLLQEAAGYARTVRAQTGTGTRSISAVTAALEELRTQVYASHGRKARTRAV
ncbi:hypothetical protein IPZ58_07510 [Streptomyces roseoverticillatus]|uniref:hypothetical protein n=1 Tax=Streptomyces roseoverticillatus TaxID=66429 RepID=UPI001F415F91|nr:hypothetical protein [Streptomyces roseoverticillatus]MCF3101426.1 hypothetical protein [Streptomyces roseoverticillatus]